jgi:hypothetical protein
MPAPVELSPVAPRSAFQIALENAVEGCVRETFAAVVAHCQAQTARDPDVRAVMAEIALDESRHARLSWQIAAWLEPRLREQEWAAVSAARRTALLALFDQLESELSAAEQALLGLPAPAVARAVIERLAIELVIG